VVTTFVHIGGVLLVFTYLIVPAVCGAYLADSIAARLVVGWLVATLGSAASICISVKANLPIGATIVCCLGVLLLVTSLVANLRGRRSPRAEPVRST
jgi:zinc/manganese transport system permease protein